MGKHTQSESLKLLVNNNKILYMTIMTSLPNYFQPLTEFDQARHQDIPAERLESVRKASNNLRDELLQQPDLQYVQSTALVRAPYPSKYAFLNAKILPTPLIHIINRVFLVQVQTDEGIKTLLLSPTHVDGSRATPYFDRLNKSFGPFSTQLNKLVAPVFTTVEAVVENAGLKPEDIDYISYDHLHTQDIRRWLGDATNPGYFPNAKLIVMKEEWDACKGLTAQQTDWYVKGGIQNVPEIRIIQLTDSIKIGNSFAIVRTPGHTMGNHSFVMKTEKGIFVTSENGVGPDCYAPEKSKIPGLKSYARKTGMEVVMNGNTLEGGLEQYISMVSEKTIAGPSFINPEFPNVACSSEFTSYWLFPGYKPSFNLGDLNLGKLVKAAASSVKNEVA